MKFGANAKLRQFFSNALMLNFYKLNFNVLYVLQADGKPNEK